MKKISSLLVFSLALVVTSVLPSFSLKGDVPPAVKLSEISDIVLIEPLAYIETYGQPGHGKNKLIYSALHSAEIKVLIKGNLAADTDLIRLSDYIPLEINIADTLYDFVQAMAPDGNTRIVSGTPGPVDALVRESGHRFALVVSETGFTADKPGEFRRISTSNVATTVGAWFGGLLGASLGWLVSSTGSISVMTIMVLDAERDEVVYIDQSVVSDLDISRPEVNNDQLRKLLGKCGFATNPVKPAN